MINYSIAIMSTTPGTKKEDITETKAYGIAQMNEKLTLDDFCQHISDHNSPFSKGVIMGIITDAVSCLREQMLAGNRVSLGDLGTFGVELACDGAKKTEDFNASYIKAVNVRWAPGDRFKNLRSEATFQLVPTREAQANATKEIKNQETIHGME